MSCKPKDRDRYGRVVALGRAYGEDLSAWMTGLGWALAFRRYSEQYVPAEAQESRDVERGIRAAMGVASGASWANQTFDGRVPMTERPTRHLALVKSGGRVVGRDAISLPAPSRSLTAHWHPPT